MSKSSTAAPAPAFGPSNAVDGAREVLRLYVDAQDLKGAKRTAATYAAKRAGVLLLPSLYVLPNVGGLRVPVSVETTGRNGVKSTTRESVPVVDAVESVVMGGAAIRSGKIVGAD